MRSAGFADRAASTSPFGGPRHRKPGARPAMRQPADRIAWMLLLESRWWETLSAVDQTLLCGLPDWHGALFRFIDRQAAEHGAMPWAVFRERVATEEWAGAALALVAAEDPGIEPVQEELALSLAQLRSAPERQAAMRVLGRL